MVTCKKFLKSFQGAGSYTGCSLYSNICSTHIPLNAFPAMFNTQKLGTTIKLARTWGRGRYFGPFLVDILKSIKITSNTYEMNSFWSFQLKMTVPCMSNDFDRCQGQFRVLINWTKTVWVCQWKISIWIPFNIANNGLHLPFFKTTCLYSNDHNSATSHPNPR